MVRFQGENLLRTGNTQRWGIATALIATLIIGVLALVPDPFFRSRVYATTFDDVEGVVPGAGVYFAGAQVGTVRSVAIDPPTRLFLVRLGIYRDWRPSKCAFAQIGAANPLAAPRIVLSAPEGGEQRCAVARSVAGCEALKPLGDQGSRITGCGRSPDLFKTAAIAVGEAAAVARTASQMATRLGAMLDGGTGSSPINMAKVAKDSTQALASLSAISQRLDSSLTPGRGDIALTLAKVRRASGRAGEFDMRSLNGTIGEVRTLVAQNQTTVSALLSEGQATAAQTRALLENISGSLVTTSANLARASETMTILTERVASDPTYVLRGQKFQDPPNPGGAR